MVWFRQAGEMSCPNQQLVSRRDALSRVGMGMGGIAFAALADEEKKLQAGTHSKKNLHDVLPRTPHFSPRAKRIVMLFQHGGPSQLDLFDPKPMLEKHAGKPVPGGVESFFDKAASGKCMPSPFRFSQHGESGMAFSELVPQLATCADDLCQIRSTITEFNDHEGAIRLFQTGKGRVGRPTMGSWVTYGLGTDNQNLPAFVVLADPNGFQLDGIKNWTSGWLPAAFQGTPVRSTGTPLFDLDLPDGRNRDMRRAQLNLLEALNDQHRQQFPHLTELEARIANYELAANIKEAVTDALDLSQETAATQNLYGVGRKENGSYGTRCLMARRLLEQGVRFVSVFNDLIMGDPWDTHFDHNKRTRKIATNIDRPCAALIKDLKQRGLLDDTIVIWAGEFGRLPIAQGKDGRDHNRYAFTTLLAGGGIQGGLTYGETDDFGYKIRENPVSINDLHATLLHQIGIDHSRLSYLHSGREESLTDTVVTGAKIIPALVEG